MSSTFFNINPQDGESNIGGILNRVRLIPILMIASFEPPALNDIVLANNAISLTPDAITIDINVAHGTGNYTQEMQENEHGESYLLNLNLELPKERPSVRTFLHRNRKYGFLAVVEDKNGYVHILGCMAQPLFITGNLVSSGSLGQKNNRVLTLSTTQEHEAYYLGNTDTLYDMQGLVSNNNLNTVLLDSIRNGEIKPQISYYAFSVANGQAQFHVPLNLQNKYITSFSINHIHYSEGIEYTKNGNTIVWNGGFEIKANYLVQVHYIDFIYNNL